MAPISNVYSSSSLLLPEEEEKEEPATIMTRKHPLRDHNEQYYHHHHPTDMMKTMVTPENDTLELHVSDLDTNHNMIIPLYLQQYSLP